MSKLNSSLQKLLQEQANTAKPKQDHVFFKGARSVTVKSYFATQG